MRIITKEGLLKEPTGTVYARYIPDIVDGELHIKVGDICNLDLIPTYECGSKEDLHRATNWSTDDLSIQADYDEDDLFAVFNNGRCLDVMLHLIWMKYFMKVEQLNHGWMPN